MSHAHPLRLPDMAKRLTKRANRLEGAVLASVIVVTIIAWAIGKVLDTVGLMVPICVVLAAFGGIVWYTYSRRKARIAYLRNKYGDEQVVQSIFQGRFWQGQTAEQLIDSLGVPTSIDTKIMATRRREVWKYKPRGINRYGLRITLDNNVVIGWDEKQW